MDILYNLDLFFVGITIASIAILGFAVFFSNRQSITNKSFLFFAIFTVIYGSFNYLSYQIISSDFTLVFQRLTIFSAVWHAFAFFQLFYVFPEERIQFPRSYLFFIIPTVIGVAFLTLTSLIFLDVRFPVSGQGVATPIPGKAVPIFGITVAALVVGGIFLLVKKWLHAQGSRRVQLTFVAWGALLTFFLLLVFNLIFPLVFDSVAFIPFAPIFMLPLIALTAYATYKHRFLDAKVIGTGIVTFLVIISTFVEILFSENITETIFRSGVFTILLSFSILLIRSVLREVEQRERLQVLTVQLEAVNGELRKLDQAKSEFISIAGHQLRTPLTIIKGYVSLGLEGSFGAVTHKLKDALGIVANSTDQLVKLVSDLLDLSRIEAGKIHYEYKTTDFNTMVEGIIKEFGPTAEKQQVKLAFENASPPLPPFYFDPDKMREVVVNLVDNAIKYSIGGTILVKIEDVDGNKKLRFSVRDHGLGIKKEDLSRLFVKFNRLEEAKRAQPNGTGIGLYFVKCIVEDHGGHVGVISDGLGKGSTFWIELPMRKE